MTIFNHSRTSVVLLFLLGLAVSPVAAQDVTELQITAASSQAKFIVMDLATLDTLEQIEFTTTTIWTDEDIVFSGVPLRALLTHLDLDGETIELVALTDYAVSMPIDAIEDNVPIIATRMNGETMSVRDKGPYWIVYPYDSNPMYQTETVYARSIWQLNRLNVVD
jgi:hypothetical protein